MMISDIMPTYSRADLTFERGEGPYLYCQDGARYLDFGSGIAVNSLGHCHPKLVSALSKQLSKLWHCSNLYRIPQQEAVAQKLVQNSFADTVFFCNSGAEAVEAGLKLVRKFHSANGNTARHRVITFSGSFHGRTLTTIAAGANEAHRAGFGPLSDTFDRVSFGNVNEVLGVITSETAAVLIEPVQGEGGIRPADPKFLKSLREVCDKYGLLLFFDEVQSGIGRTGHLFGHQHFGVVPDIVALAKGLGGGFPVGACLATFDAAVGMTAGTHGSTFGGNPMAMTVANTVLETLLERGYLEQIQKTGTFLMECILNVATSYPDLISEVRGVGMMLGIKCVNPAQEMVTACRNAGLLTVPAGDNVVRLLPPLIIDTSHVEEAVDMVNSACKAMVS